MSSVGRLLASSPDGETNPVAPWATSLGACDEGDLTPRACPPIESMGEDVNLTHTFHKGSLRRWDRSIIHFPSFNSQIRACQPAPQVGQGGFVNNNLPPPFSQPFPVGRLAGRRSSGLQGPRFLHRGRR